MEIKEIRDNGGKSFDRYTVVYDAYCGDRFYESVSMSADPFHPQGVAQRGEAYPGKHLGKRIAFSKLPEACQKLVKKDLLLV